jgi:hypothetical protein
MIAIKLGLRLAIAMGYCDKHFLVKSNNMGVIGVLEGGCSQNREQNSVLQQIVAPMRQHGLWVMSLYVESAKNIADWPLQIGLCKGSQQCIVGVVVQQSGYRYA